MAPNKCNLCDYNLSGQFKIPEYEFDFVIFRGKLKYSFTHLRLFTVYCMPANNTGNNYSLC